MHINAESMLGLLFTLWMSFSLPGDISKQFTDADEAHAELGKVK